MTKQHKCGLYLGRFQPLHLGHTSIINQMLDECEKIIIAVGSAQKSGTERNPLSFDFRKYLIEETYYDVLDNIVIIPINDRERYSDDSSWGDYLFNQIYEQTTLRPDAIYEGEESVNTNWYDNRSIQIVKVPRTDIPISATEIRNAILHDELDFALDRLPYAIFEYFGQIRKEIQNAATNSRCNQMD